MCHEDALRRDLRSAEDELGTLRRECARLREQHRACVMERGLVEAALEAAETRLEQQDRQIAGLTEQLQRAEGRAA